MLRNLLCGLVLLGVAIPGLGCRSDRHHTKGSEEFAPFVFIHAGDPQIGCISLPSDKQRFIELAHRANELKPAFVLVVGDLVNDGAHRAQLRAFDEALAEFRVPVKLLPGNHDDLSTYTRRYGYDYYAFTHNNCEFVCLDSTRLAVGGAGAQWRWIERTLRAARQAHRTHLFLALHHPPTHLGTDAKERLEELIRRHGVRIVLAGHAHRTQELKAEEYTTYTVGGTAFVSDKRGFGYRVWRVSAESVEEKYVTLKRGKQQPDLTTTMSCAVR